MKTFFGAVLIGVLLVAGGIYFDQCIENFSMEMLAESELLGQKVSLGKGEEVVDSMNNYLNKKKILLASIINHDSINQIETCITELKEYIIQKDEKEASVRCEKLKHLLERLPMEYGVSLQNIL